MVVVVDQLSRPWPRASSCDAGQCLPEEAPSPRPGLFLVAMVLPFA